MNNLSQLLEAPPYSMGAEAKMALYTKELSGLLRHHFNNCEAYKRILDSLKLKLDTDMPLEDQPFLPVRMFKEFELKSISDKAILKTMTSSGTSGQRVSRIFLDKTTAAYQTKVLSKIMADLLGPTRLPMLVIDAKETIKNRHNFSARGAGIIGFSMFGRDVTFALDENMQLNQRAVEAFCDKHAGKNIFVFGFTSIVYQHLIQPLMDNKVCLPLDRGILLHGGGWKKLEGLAIDNGAYKKILKDTTGIKRVHNYYGMVEQTGSIFPECEAGVLHCSSFSDILIRDKKLQILPHRNKGLIQLASLLPHSYPGHNILTEDIGEILGQDDCSCGRKGKYFRIYGRAKQAEVRGCSDTYRA